jgi:transcriptional regulator with XRE-family HTH domain
VKNNASAAGDRRADPEEQAGKALRKLRLARNWSQQEVATRMTAYGYDFHQTTIAKIEAAQRPLRLRELADFAALYGVEVQELVHAPTRALPEVDQEIEDIAAQLGQAQAAAVMSAQNVEATHAAARDAETAHQAALANLAVLTRRLDALVTDREKLRRWNPSGDSTHEKPDDGDRRDALRPEAVSVAATAQSSPSVLRIHLGSHLRRLRQSKGIAAEQAAQLIRCPPSKIFRLESGRVRIRERDLVDLLIIYGVTDAEERSEWLDLAKRANAPSWWESYSDILPNWFEPYIGLETAATAIRIFEARQIPDLLQTDNYSYIVDAKMYESHAARHISQRIQLRAVRRERLLERSDAPHLQVVLDEAVLRRPVGGEAVMREQVRYLAKVAGLPNIEIQVLPLTASTLATIASFRILHFSEAEMRDIVYLEQHSSALYLDKRPEVDTYLRAMHQLTSGALPTGESVSFLHRMVAAYSD